MKCKLMAIIKEIVCTHTKKSRKQQKEILKEMMIKGEKIKEVNTKKYNNKKT